MSDSNSRLVYSTETGRIDEPKAAPVRPKGDGVVRIQRQTSGRKGKGVCLITGVDLDDAELTKLAAELKKKCGCGGAVKRMGGARGRSHRQTRRGRGSGSRRI